MSLIEIAAMPTTVDRIPEHCRGVHESVLRAYNILALVKRWLKDGAPASIILEVIDDLENGRNRETDVTGGTQ